jgi:hypothetical protein
VEGDVESCPPVEGDGLVEVADGQEDVVETEQFVRLII